jgi:putative methionine-R-sulfoxide reductase with GAF domain
MAEELIISKGSSKEELYKTLYPQLESLVENEDDLIANMFL